MPDSRHERSDTIRESIALFENRIRSVPLAAAAASLVRAGDTGAVSGVPEGRTTPGQVMLREAKRESLYDRCHELLAAQAGVVHG